MEQLTVNGVMWDVNAISEILNSESTNLVEQPMLISISDKIDFSHMVWDFSSQNKFKDHSNQYIYKFNEISTVIYRIFLKRVVLREIYINRNRFSSTFITFSDVKNLINYLEKEKYIIEPKLINESSVKQYLNDKCSHLTEKTKKRTLINIKKFLLEIEMEVESFEINSFENILTSIDDREVKAQSIIGKTKNIPRTLFNNIVKLALTDINDNRMDNYSNVSDFSKKKGVSKATIINRINKNDYIGVVKTNAGYLIPKVYLKSKVNDIEKLEELANEFIKNPPPTLEEKMISCMILLLSQIGMRRGEFLLLEIDRLKEMKILNGEKTAYFLEFFTYKTSPTIDGKWTETFMNDIAVKAYKNLEKLTKNRRKNGQIALYANPKGTFYAKTNITDHINQFFLRHQNKLNFDKLSELEMENVVKWEIKKSDTVAKHLTNSDIGKIIYKINPHQFRVAVANEMRRKGVSLQWIKKHMNHLEEEMTKHYFRDEDNIREALVNRTSKDGKSLEINADNIDDIEIKKELNDPYFQEAYKVINKFLKKKKFNIFKDLNKIIEILKESPINESELGYCTMAMGRICERQEKLATFEKWYYLRPQIIDVESFNFTYKRFLDKIKLIEHNKKVSKKDSRYIRQYEIEVKSFDKFFNDKFLPEFKMLQNEVKEKGMEYSIKNYPDLKEIIKNINNIESEVKKWINH